MYPLKLLPEINYKHLCTFVHNVYGFYHLVFVIDGTDITFQDEVQSTYACRFGVVYLLPHYSKGSETVMLDINGKPLTCSVWRR